MNRKKTFKKQESYNLSDDAVESLYDKQGIGWPDRYIIF